MHNYCVQLRLGLREKYRCERRARCAWHSGIVAAPRSLKQTSVAEHIAKLEVGHTRWAVIAVAFRAAHTRSSRSRGLGSRSRDVGQITVYTSRRAADLRGLAVPRSHHHPIGATGGRGLYCQSALSLWNTLEL